MIKKLCEFPEGWHGVSRNKRASEAAALLMRCIGSWREANFQLTSEPDKGERRKPAADFVYTEVGSGRTVAVEFTEFTNAAVEEASALLKGGKKIRAREGVRPIERAETQLGLVEPARSYPQDFRLLDEFVADKISKGQLQETEAAERILLIYDANSVPESSFVQSYHCQLTSAQRDSVDHAYVILEQRNLYPLW